MFLLTSIASASLPADAASLGKPLIIEEFGTQRAGRDAYFSAAFQAVEASLSAGGPLKGALFWQLYAPGQVGRATQLCRAVWLCSQEAPGKVGQCCGFLQSQDGGQPRPFKLQRPAHPETCRLPVRARAAAPGSLASTLQTAPSSWSRPTLRLCSS